MASAAVTAAQAELISSLSQDEIPIKLRCAICSRLAVNAFRLPCCEQAICETCQSTLPSSCPVCEHTPVSGEDCKPNKSLRTTIKVFLRTEEKKREAIRLKEAKNTPPITPVEPVAVAIEAPKPAVDILEAELAAEVQADAKAVASPIADQAETASGNLDNSEQTQEAQQDIPQPSIEEIAPGQESILNGDANQVDDAAAENGEGETAEKDANGESTSGQGVSQTPGFGAGFGFDPSTAGAFPGMGIGGDFSQMQMMMGMQNGMAPNAFGAFPMMGMPGMGMDPMAMQQMQSMMMSGGFGGVNGMNGMNGMGMGGFDGNVGAGFNTGWNNQQAWNGQDNFNHPNAAGIGHGDYSSNNSGYNSHSSGYNQGNYGRGNQFNDYQNNSYGYRGRGRGRGYGRGGYGHGSNEHFSQQNYQQHGSGQQPNGPVSEIGSVPTGPKAEVAVPNPDVDEFGREIRHISESKDVPHNEASDKPQDENTSTAVTTDPLAAAGHNSELNEVAMDVATADDDSTPRPIQTLDEAEATSYAANGTYNAASSRGGFNPGYQGRGTNFMQPPYVKPVDVPINAPTGPKAMREGLPNTSFRGRGFSIAGRAASSRPNGSVSVAPEPTPSENDGKERERSRSPSKERSRSQDRDRSRSRDRHSRRHRHRSTSLTEDDKETERRRQRRKERRRRHEEEGDGRDEVTPGDKPMDEEVKEGGDEAERSRSQSPSDAKRSSHRSRRDKDKYRDREDRDKYRDRDEDRDYKSSHKHRSSRRHHDDRSRSRDRERDREHRHRRSRHASEDVDERGSNADKSLPPTPIEQEDPSRRPSVVASGVMGIEIKGVSSRRKSTITEEIAIPTGPRSERPLARDREKEKSSRRREEDDSRHRSSRHRDSDREREKERAKEKERSRVPTTAPAVQDPHTAEREKRDRDRLLKEAQRMAGLVGGGGHKRSRDDPEDLGRKGRKKRGRGDESDEGRIARLEAERESARWD